MCWFTIGKIRVILLLYYFYIIFILFLYYFYIIFILILYYFLYRDNTTKELVCTFAFAVDELKMIHYYNVLSGGGEAHNAMCWVLGKAIAENIWYRTSWTNYTDQPDKPEFDVQNMNFIVGSDTADKDSLMGPRLFNQIVQYLGLVQILSSSSLIVTNHYKHQIDLKKFTLSVVLYYLYIIFVLILYYFCINFILFSYVDGV